MLDSISLATLRMFEYPSGMYVWVIDQKGMTNNPIKSLSEEHPQIDNCKIVSVAITLPLGEAILAQEQSFQYKVEPNGDEYYWSSQIPTKDCDQFFDYLKIDAHKVASLVLQPESSLLSWNTYYGLKKDFPHGPIGRTGPTRLQGI